MLEYIRNELLGMTDKGEYVAFTSSLIPGCDNIIGIRQPVLKQYAKQLIKENKDFRQLLSEPDIYQEETLLRSYIIGMGTAKEKDFKKALKDFNTFVPLVNNWAFFSAATLPCTASGLPPPLQPKGSFISSV